MHLLVNWVSVLLDHSGFRSLAAAVMDEEFLLARIERRPNVLAEQAFGNLPWLFENVDLSLRVNLADEVQASGRQRQLCWYLCDLSARQFWATQLTSGLLDRQPAQLRRSVMLVPGEELRALAIEITERGAMVLVPASSRPRFRALARRRDYVLPHPAERRSVPGPDTKPGAQIVRRRAGCAPAL